MPQFLNILLQKSDADLSWGFDVAGGRGTALPLTVCKVNANSFSAPYISKGDSILQIDGTDASFLTETEAITFIKRPSKSLELIICKAKQCPKTWEHSGSAHKLGTTLSYEYSRNGLDTDIHASHPHITFAPLTDSSSYNETDSPTSSTSRQSSYKYFTSLEDTSSATSSDLECDREIANYNKLVRSANVENFTNHQNRLQTTHKTIIHSNQNTQNWLSNNGAAPSNNNNSNSVLKHFAFHMRASPTTMSSQDSSLEVCPQWAENVSRIYIVPQNQSCVAQINIQGRQEYPYTRKRSTKQSSENGNSSEVHAADVSATTPSATLISVPPTIAPPPPPPPLPINGNAIPTIRLKSEISDRQDPPAMLQTSMAKDKKPFSYAPGGIDFSEIKSPRMQRRIIRNSQEPEDVVLPPTSTSPVNTNLLPPAAVAAMTPQMAIPVFPQNNGPILKKSNVNVNSNATLEMQPPPSTPPQPPQSSSSPLPKIPSLHQSQPTNQRPVTPPPPNKKPILKSQPTNQKAVTPPPPPKVAPSHQTVTMTHNAPSTASLINHHSSIKSPAIVSHDIQSSTSAPPKNQNNIPVQNMTFQTKVQPIQTEGAPTHVRSIYIPPVTNKEYTEKEQQKSHSSFPTLREAPTPWLQKQQQPQDNVAPWVNRNNEKTDQNQKLDKEQVYERKAKNKPAQVQQKDTQLHKTTDETHIIPIRIENSDRVIIQQEDTKKKPTSQRWSNSESETNNYMTNNNIINNNNNNNNRLAINGSSINKGFSDNHSKPIQSRAFKVLQKITGSEDDTTDFNSNRDYNSEGVPLSQLRKLQLNNDDRAFMNQVKAQVDDETFLHMETDPRYRGSVIPSRAFRMLQNMTDNGQVTTNTMTASVPRPNHESNTHHIIVNKCEPSSPPTPNISNRVIIGADEEPSKKAYIPPSERQAEQELRKYMGSSIPSRSFRMLQAMTATQNPFGRTGESDY